MHYEKIRKQKFRSPLDTGAEVYLINEKVFENTKQKPELTRWKVVLELVGGEALHVKGSTDLEISVENGRFVHTFHVIGGLNKKKKIGY